MEAKAHDSNWEAAVGEANDIFDRLRQSVENASGSKGAVDVVAIAQEAGISVDEGTLEKLGVPAKMQPHPFLPWFMWFPWRPLWAQHWDQQYPGSEPVAAYTPQGGTDTSGFLTQARIAGMVVCP